MSTTTTSDWVLLKVNFSGYMFQVIYRYDTNSKKIQTPVEWEPEPNSEGLVVMSVETQPSDGHNEDRNQSTKMTQITTEKESRNVVLMSSAPGESIHTEVATIGAMNSCRKRKSDDKKGEVNAKSAKK